MFSPGLLEYTGLLVRLSLILCDGSTATLLLSPSLFTLVSYYLRQVNEVNGGDNAFVRCVFVGVCLCVCVCLCVRSGRSWELNANSSKTVKATDF